MRAGQVADNASARVYVYTHTHHSATKFYLANAVFFFQRDIHRLIHLRRNGQWNIRCTGGLVGDSQGYAQVHVPLAPSYLTTTI